MGNVVREEGPPVLEACHLDGFPPEFCQDQFRRPDDQVQGLLRQCLDLRIELGDLSDPGDRKDQEIVAVAVVVVVAVGIVVVVGKGIGAAVLLLLLFQVGLELGRDAFFFLGGQGPECFLFVAGEALPLGTDLFGLRRDALAGVLTRNEGRDERRKERMDPMARHFGWMRTRV